MLDVNEQACSSLGRSRESLIGEREFDLGVEKAVVDRISDRLDAGELLVLDTMHQGPNGECFPVELRIRPFTEAGQRYSVSSARDITERKRAEAELRASHDLLHAVVEGTSDAVFVKDVDGRYLLLERGGWPPAGPVGRERARSHRCGDRGASATRGLSGQRAAGDVHRSRVLV